jgi:pyruvate-formate lyase-activating enzyme
MPPSANFSLLHFEPDAEMINEAVNDAFEASKITVTSMESEEITFAGFGEPLLRADVIKDAAKLIKLNRHGVSLRIKTNGLIQSKECASVSTN